LGRDNTFLMGTPL